MWTIFIIVLLPSGVHGGEFAFFSCIQTFWFGFVYCQEDTIKTKEDMKVFLDLKFCKIYKHCTLVGTWESHCLNLILGL